MKKITILLPLLLLLGCSKLQAKDTPLNQVLEEIKVIAEFENTETLDLTNQKYAAQYGIDPTSISEGYAYYSLNEDTSDLVIIARASSQSEVENLEKSISSDLNAITASWQNNTTESEKIKNSVTRTIGDCVLLAVGDKSDEIDQVFNQLKQD